MSGKGLRLGGRDNLSGLFDGDCERLRRVILEQDGENDDPERCGRVATRPVVDLARRDAGEPGEGCLADVGAAEEGGEFGGEEGAHRPLSIDVAFRIVPEHTVNCLSDFTHPHCCGNYAVAPEKCGIGPENRSGAWSVV